jgi:pentatricopeptide repeat protein
MISVLNFMKENSLPITASTYGILIRELVARNMMDTVGTVLDQMRENDIKPTVDLYNSLMQIFGHAGDIHLS